MRVVTYAELLACPPGTIYCESSGENYPYADSLYRKGANQFDGYFCKTELLPQPVGGPSCFQCTTSRPPPDEGEQVAFYVFEPADVAELVARLTAPGDVYYPWPGEPPEKVDTPA